MNLVRSIGVAGWRLNISVALALEYEGVLKRDGMLQELTEAEIDNFLDYLFKTSHLVPFVHRMRPCLPDPDDERILEVAVRCGAMIVTHNTRDFVGAKPLGVTVRTPAEILEDDQRKVMSVSISVPDELYQKAVAIARAQDSS
jgi:predicted nucleic acid-binding protein